MAYDKNSKKTSFSGPKSGGKFGGKPSGGGASRSGYKPKSGPKEGGGERSERRYGDDSRPQRSDSRPARDGARDGGREGSRFEKPARPSHFKPRGERFSEGRDDAAPKRRFPDRKDHSRSNSGEDRDSGKRYESRGSYGQQDRPERSSRPSTFKPRGERTSERFSNDRDEAAPKRRFGERPERKEFGRDADKRYGAKPRTAGASYRGNKFGDEAKPARFEKPSRPAHAKPHAKPHEKPYTKDYDSAETLNVEKKKFPPKSAAKSYYGPAAVSEKSENRDSIFLWGVHAVRAAWLNPERRCYRLWMTDTAHESFEDAFEKARSLGLARPNVKIVVRAELDAILPKDAVHQGIVLEVDPLPAPLLDNILESETPPDLIVVLDQVTDPHNVGAILRSAAAFGAGAVIVTERNAPATTGVMAKTACGAADMVPLVAVVNLARALQMLKKAGYWCVGFAEEGTKSLAEVEMKGRVALIMGAEGEGLRRLTREHCDVLARLPTQPPLGSLNVSNAAAIALYEFARQK